MNITRLRHFAIVAETKNLRRAAELIGMSPGALSRSLKSLESELSVRLFSTNGRSLTLNDDGRAVYPMAARLLAESRAFEEAVKNRSAKPVPVRFCSHSVFTTYFIGFALKHYLQDCEVLVRNAVPGDIELSIINRQADFGFTYLPVAQNGIEFLPVTQIAMGPFAKSGAFVGVAQEEMPWSAPMFKVADATGGNSPIDAWPGRLPRGNVRFHFDLLETALSTCREGLSLGYFPIFLVWLHNELVRKENRLLLIETPAIERARLQAFLVRRQGEEESLAEKRFCKALRIACKQAEEAVALEPFRKRPGRKGK